MQRSTRNQAFAGSRQQRARNLIDFFTDRGMKITEISKETRIATSTIAKWWHDAAPNPRTLARLEGLKSRIDEQDKRLIVIEEGNEWHDEGGLDRVKKFKEWMRVHGDELRTDSPNFETSFAHYKVEQAHQSKGNRLRLCDNRMM